jgi:hypothetical protein
MRNQLSCFGGLFGSLLCNDLLDSDRHFAFRSTAVGPGIWFRTLFFCLPRRGKEPAVVLFGECLCRLACKAVVVLSTTTSLWGGCANRARTPRKDSATNTTSLLAVSGVERQTAEPKYRKVQGEAPQPGISQPSGRLVDQLGG